MIDSHCHLDHEFLYTNINDVLIRSKKIGITKLLSICTTHESFNKILEIIELDSMIYGTFGIHPHETDKNLISKEIIIKNVSNNDKIIGIGETGLDFYYNHSDKNKQISSFNFHIEAAINLDLPIIVHSRNAEDETFEILNSSKNKKLKIIMHCFTGSKQFSIKLLNLDSFFSASGIITFKNSLDLQQTFKSIPLDKLLIETDSPYLAPIPMRGKKNEPSFIDFTLKKLSELKNISKDDLDIITSKNFNNLFGFLDN